MVGAYDLWTFVAHFRCARSNYTRGVRKVGVGILVQEVGYLGEKVSEGGETTVSSFFSGDLSASSRNERIGKLFPNFTHALSCAEELQV